MKLTFSDTITAADNHRHIPHVFEVPEGTTRVHIELAYEPRFGAGQLYHNQMSLSVADPAGPRGVYYLLRDYGVDITEARCTPGFNAGPVRPGTWQVDLDTYRLLPPDPITYRIEVTLSREEITEPKQVFSRPAPVHRGPGWYKGDIHAHSLHSDASWDVRDLVAYARHRRHDFSSLTDHNTVSGLPEHESHADESLLTIGGLELTTYYGHAVVLGTRQWHEWRLDTPERLTMPEIARRAMASGGFFIIAHPMNAGDPECAGCRWTYTDMLPGNAPAVEIWNQAWNPCNENALQLYYGWLNRGLKLTATGGTDLHGHPGMVEPRYGTNVIYAEDLTEAELVSALRKGHSYLSAGPVLLLTARGEDGSGAISGDSLMPGAADIAVQWDAVPAGCTLRFITDGQVREEKAIPASGSANWHLDQGDAAWCTCEIRDSEGDMWAVSNPIFLDGRRYEEKA